MVMEDEYDLLMSPDVNTLGHTQWFYFSIKGAKAGSRYIFNIGMPP